MSGEKKVLLTGVTGFVGAHTTIQLLEKGYEVIGTLRDITKAPELKKILAKYTTAIDNLSFHEASLDDAEIWQKLCHGMDYIQHIASPFPKTTPKDENELILPAKNGTLNILSAALENKVKRVVITGSSSAVSYGQIPERINRTYSEQDWSNENYQADMTPYFKSKTISEKAAWEFHKKYQQSFELTVVCPGLILGPLLEKEFNTSTNVIIKLMDGSFPAVPKLGFDIVDVRSIASLLILAMEKPQAANQRYIGSNGYLTLLEIAAMLRKTYPKLKIPSREFPNWIIRLISNFDATLKPVLLDLNTKRKLNNTKAKKDLGWNPMTAEEAVLSCGESILELGIIKNN